MRRRKDVALVCRTYGISRVSSHTAKEFIDTLLRGMPFKVKAIQVDGGSEFYSEFERECERRGTKLFVLPPEES